MSSRIDPLGSTADYGVAALAQFGRELRGDRDALLARSPRADDRDRAGVRSEVPRVNTIGGMWSTSRSCAG